MGKRSQKVPLVHLVHLVHHIPIVLPRKNFRLRSIIVSETTEIRAPALAISRVEISPLAKARAFGGVEIGSAIAKEHENATVTASSIGAC